MLLTVECVNNCHIDVQMTTVRVVIATLAVALATEQVFCVIQTATRTAFVVLQTIL